MFSVHCTDRTRARSCLREGWGERDGEIEELKDDNALLN